MNTHTYTKNKLYKQIIFVKNMLKFKSVKNMLKIRIYQFFLVYAKIYRAEGFITKTEGFITKTEAS
jgi:hypothetical protein